MLNPVGLLPVTALLLSAPHASRASGDGAPPGMVAFFMKASCPAGWSPARYAAGRLVLAASEGAVPPITVGTALGNVEDRKHSHKYEISGTIGSKSIAAASSCCNDSAARRGQYGVSATTEPATTGLPFIQLTICERSKPGAHR